ncbi:MULTISPECIES: hypothetical protein [unclassified Nocardiopsis]|jgi:hypothetical protein|uniref:hypothetical protein n=1 Tax=unclassified Nocardiopsis TaxID=2649073 RepID=UPI00066B225D|nr:MULTISPECIES: hypothetical protein [unclassified Nocardiopsis]MBQ1084657.1 hypothetical protein [Nocardiopsis sp. B62]
MRLIPSSPLSCLGTAVAAVVIGGVVLVGCDVVDLDLDLSMSSGGSDSPEEEASASPSPEEEPEEEEASAYGLPESCEAAGAAQIVGDLAPGQVLTEESGEIEGIEDAEQLSCTFSDGSTEPGTPSFTLVFTSGADPSANPDVVQVPGAEAEMNWEVDVDVDVDTYHTEDSDDLGADLEYVGTVDGSSRHLYLQLPGDFHVTAIAYFEDVERGDLERVVFQAAGQIRN